MASPKPQVIVRREFELTADVTDLPLQACIIGPAGLAVTAADRDDIVEEYGLEGAWQYPQKTGFLEGADDIVSVFHDDAGHPFYNTGVVATADASSSVDLVTGAEMDENSLRVDLDDALIRIGRTTTIEAAAWPTPTCVDDLKNVVDFGTNIVSKPGYPRHEDLAVDAQVGDVVTITANSAEYVTTIIGFNTNDDGSVTQAVLSNNVSDGGSPYPATNLSILRRITNISVPKLSSVGVNWRYIDSSTSVFWGGHDGAGVSLTSDGLLLEVPELGAGEFECIAGVAYASFTAFLSDAISNEVQVAESLADIREAFGDNLNPNNPLGWAVYTAKLNSGGVPVLYIQTANQTLSEYTRAVAIAETERSCYSIVPCTEDAAIHSLIEGHISENSDPNVGRFRIGFFAPEVEETRNHTILYYTATSVLDDFPDDVYDPAGAATTAAVTVLDEDGTTVSATTTSVLIEVDTANAENPFTETQAGDLVYINAVASSWNSDTDVDLTYSSADLVARVTEVTNNDSLVAVIIEGTPTGAVTLSDTTYIQSVNSGSVVASKYAQTARGFDNERVFLVVSDRGVDGLKVNGDSVKNIYAAAAFAGLRATSAPQQPLSNVTINGFDGVNENEVLFTERDMTTMRDAGVWIVRQPKTGADAGAIFAQRQLSTSNLDIYRKEQSVTTNLDNVGFALLDGLNKYVGRLNITDGTMQLIETELGHILREKTAAASVTLGPQLSDYEIVSIERVEASLGTLKVQISLDVPLPMNTIDITLVI